MNYSKFYNSKIVEMIIKINSLEKVVAEDGDVKYIGDDIVITAPNTAIFNVITHKLLVYSIILFTEKYNKKNFEKARVGFSVESFLKICGLSTINRSSKDRGQKEIKKSLQTLISARINIKEGNGKYMYKNDTMQMFDNRSTLKNGVVYIYFTDEFSEYLIIRPIARYPYSLFQINGKKHNAYSIGFKMALHSSNQNNIRKGTSRTLSVKNILKSTTYPSIKRLKSSRQSWQHKIKKRFENDLDYLMTMGVLDIWRYRVEPHNKFAKFIDFVTEKIEFDFSE